MNPYKDIEAYRVSPLLCGTDFLLVFPLLQCIRLRKATSLSLELGGGDTEWQSEEDRQMIREDFRHGATFLTNHRDIIMDAAWLSYLLRTHYFIRPYMGIGNNLLSRRWIEWLVRFNRCYVVVRDGGVKEAMKNAQHLSSYIQYLRSKGKSIWLAQREGRAKDGNDLTQPAVLKMLTIGESNFLDAVRRLLHPHLATGRRRLRVVARRLRRRPYFGRQVRPLPAVPADGRHPRGFRRGGLLPFPRLRLDLHRHPRL